MFAATALSTRRNGTPVDPIYVADYNTLRGITTNSMIAFITGYFSDASTLDDVGWFIRDDNDLTTPDNGYSVIVASNGKRWKRTIDAALQLQTVPNYTALRAYGGISGTIYITGFTGGQPSPIAGYFQYDSVDVVSADNGGTIIVDALGRRWKRSYAGNINLRWFGAVGDGVVNDRAAILAADAASGGSIDIPAGNYRITGNTTINSTLNFSKNAVLVPDVGTTVTLTGTIVAGNYQIFTSTGGIFVGNLKNIDLHVAWWGAIVGGGPDQSPAIQRAVDFMSQGWVKTLNFESLHYKCDTAITAPNLSGRLVGGGSTPFVGTSTLLDFSSAPAGTIGFTVNSVNGVQLYGVEIENINFYRSTGDVKNSGGVGLFIRGVSRLTLRGVVSNAFDVGLRFDTTTIAGTTVQGIIVDCGFNGLKQPIEVLGAIDVTFEKTALSGTATSDRLILINFGANGTPANACHFNECIFVDSANLQPELASIRAGFWHTFHNCVFERATGNAITVFYNAAQDLGLINVQVDTCWFDNVGAALANVGFRTNYELLNSRISAVGLNAIYGATSEAGTLTKHIIVRNNNIQIGTAGATCVFITGHRGAIIDGNTFKCFGPAAAAATVTTAGSADQTHVTNNHSLTTNADVNGFALAGTNPVTVNNTKAAT